MTRVVVSGLKKSFGKHVVLDNLDLEVPEGSLTAVLGPSGSGKTTLLRLLAGFERPDEGLISIGGTVVEDGHTHLPPESRRVGYVPQDGALFPHLNAAGNIGFGLPRSERKSGRVEELLKLVGLVGEGQRYPHQLSGGMQQRVALARALAARPSLVLLDEPFAALADRVAVLRAGRVAQCAGPEEIYLDPLDPALASFVGDANLLPGTVSGGMAMTALGPLAIADASSPVRESEQVMVLVRPEQVELHAANGAGGLTGLVVNCHYYGHDMLVTIEMTGAGGRRSLLSARLTGRTPLGTGSAVTVAVGGPVKVWRA
jgi:iron(III) transport system ATP-binding protein